MNIAEKTVDNTISLSQKLYMKNHYRHHHIVTLLRLLILILFLGTWEYAGRIELIDTFFFSSPSMIAAYFKEMLLDGLFYYPYRDHFVGNSDQFFTNHLNLNDHSYPFMVL